MTKNEIANNNIAIFSAECTDRFYYFSNRFKNSAGGPSQLSQFPFPSYSKRRRHRNLACICDYWSILFQRYCLYIDSWYCRINRVFRGYIHSFIEVTFINPDYYFCFNSMVIFGDAAFYDYSVTFCLLDYFYYSNCKFV